MIVLYARGMTRRGCAVSPATIDMKCVHQQSSIRGGDRLIWTGNGECRPGDGTPNALENTRRVFRSEHSGRFPVSEPKSVALRVTSEHRYERIEEQADEEDDFED